jgi:hypothetical protein
LDLHLKKGRYPFAAAAERPGITIDELVEEIDIGGPSMVRAAAKNHASVAVVTSPARYPQLLDALARDGRVPDGLRAALAIEAFRHTAAHDPRITTGLPSRMAAAGVGLPDEPGLPGATDPYPPTLTIGLEKVGTLRYGENPHQLAARYRRPGPDGTDGPFASGEPPLQVAAGAPAPAVDRHAREPFAQDRLDRPERRVVGRRPVDEDERRPGTGAEPGDRRAVGGADRPSCRRTGGLPGDQAVTGWGPSAAAAARDAASRTAASIRSVSASESSWTLPWNASVQLSAGQRFVYVISRASGSAGTAPPMPSASTGSVGKRHG